MPATSVLPRRIEARREARVSLTLAVAAACSVFAPVVRAETEGSASAPAEAPPQAPTDEPKKAPSPWLLLPTFSNNPKLGTSLGALAGYVRKFDPVSYTHLTLPTILRV